MKSFDPQKYADRVLKDTQRLRGGSRDKAYWRRIEDLASALMETASKETDTGTTGGKKPTKRWRADLMKAAAILQESAARHIEIQREPDPPQIVEGALSAVIKLLEER